MANTAIPANDLACISLTSFLGNPLDNEIDTHYLLDEDFPRGFLPGERFGSIQETFYFTVW
jgi:hypothetical protein